MQRAQLNSERGAILIHVAVASLVLIAFTMFVADYGILAVSRHQAQNAADSGALAGATALAFDDFDDRTNTGPAKVAARAFALSNDVWSEDPEVNIDTDVVFVDCPDDDSPPPILQTPCIRVDVYRGAVDRTNNGTVRGNPLPMWFGQLVGLTNQGVRATAVGRAGWGNGSNCMKPWAIPDKWRDDYDETPENPGNAPPAWTDGDDFEPEQTPPDVYIAPGENGSNDPGTGFTTGADLGTRIVLKHGTPNGPNGAISPSHFYPIVLPGTGRGGSEYGESIATCQGGTIEVGDWIEVEPGNMVGPTRQGVDDLIALDPTAYWHVPAGGAPDEGFVTRPGLVDEGGMQVPVSSSARIVCAPAFDPDDYYDSRMHGRLEIRISNILGFFIDSMQGNDVIGWLTHCPGVDTGTGSLPGPSAFIPIIQLVR